jgi:hypothetical protein
MDKFCLKVAVAHLTVVAKVAVAGWQWLGGSGSGWVAVGDGLQNDLKMSEIDALLSEIWTSLHKCGSGSGWVAVVEIEMSNFATHFLFFTTKTNKKIPHCMKKKTYFPM